MKRPSRNSIPPAEFPHPDSHHVTVKGPQAGVINFSRLPETVSAEDVHMRLLTPLGASLGAIDLPVPPGVFIPESPDERRRALRINIFRDQSAEAYGASAYVLATEAALEQISQQSSGGPVERQGIVTLHEGDVMPVGRGYWLPSVGSHVELLHNDPKLARMYSATHSDQGAFRVEHGELLYEDHGSKNRVNLTHGGLETEHLADQGFIQTGRIASQIPNPTDIPGLHDATNQQ